MRLGVAGLGQWEQGKSGGNKVPRAAQQVEARGGGAEGAGRGAVRFGEGDAEGVVCFCVLSLAGDLNVQIKG